MTGLIAILKGNYYHFGDWFSVCISCASFLGRGPSLCCLYGSAFAGKGPFLAISEIHFWIRKFLVSYESNTHFKFGKESLCSVSISSLMSTVAWL